jgi:predicted O-linked N-acetylglucosamine transferase (SPINDLY family)
MLQPNLHAAAINLGLTLELLGQSEKALQCWMEALQSDAERTALLNHRARLLEQLGRLEEAEAVLRVSLNTLPSQPDAIQHWVHIRQKLCQWPILESDIPGLKESDLLRQSGPLGVLALTDDVAVQREVTAAWIARKTHPEPARLSPPEGYRHDRMRIGYMSSDFCSHAMAYLIAEMIECHDRSRFAVYGYCSSRDDRSDVRGRLVAAFDAFRTIRLLSDAQAAQLICADEIDILVDLNGLTSGARLQILRWRPAPIQATYLGFIGPVPLPELDYMFCDTFVIPPQTMAEYWPTPMAIAPLYQANDRKRAIGTSVRRAEEGLPDSSFVFCCFSNHYKVTEAVFGAWMEILRRVPHGVLWLVAGDQTAEANLRLHAAGLGVDPARLLFAERVAPARYMARLALADLFLDTFPYNAGTIASDAIRMQLPLLTLCGRSFASRMAARFLEAVDARLGIASDLRAYIETAVLLATDPMELAAYTAAFTKDAWDRTLGQTPSFMAAYEEKLCGLQNDFAGIRRTV